LGVEILAVSARPRCLRWHWQRLSFQFRFSCRDILLLEKTGLAVAIASAGSATGGLVYPSIIRQLLPSVGFAWVMRILALVQLTTMLAIHSLLRARVKPRTHDRWLNINDFRRLIDLRALTRLDFIFYATGSFLVRLSGQQTHFTIC
jgi:hypothetical protein